MALGIPGQGEAVPRFAGVPNGGVGTQGRGGAAGVGRQGQGGIAPAGVYGGIGIQGQGGAMAGAAGVQNDGAGPRPINAQNGGIPAQAVWVPDVGGNAPAGEQQVHQYFLFFCRCLDHYLDNEILLDSSCVLFSFSS